MELYTRFQGLGSVQCWRSPRLCGLLNHASLATRRVPEATNMKKGVQGRAAVVPPASTGMKARPHPTSGKVCRWSGRLQIVRIAGLWAQAKPPERPPPQHVEGASGRSCLNGRPGIKEQRSAPLQHRGCRRSAKLARWRWEPPEVPLRPGRPGCLESLDSSEDAADAAAV